MEDLVCTIVESPYAAETEEGVAENLEYLTRCLLDSFAREEAPFASHGFYTMFLDDNDEDHRKLGMLAGWTWAARAPQIAFYIDRGMSQGMLLHLELLAKAPRNGQRILFRSIEEDHGSAWMRERIDELPEHIRSVLQSVVVS